MTTRTLELSDYDDVVRMLYQLVRKNDEESYTLSGDIYAIIDKLEELK